MDGSQITGASSSYARKYALNGLFNIDDTKDSDVTNTEDQTKENKLRDELNITLKEFSDRQDLIDKMESIRDVFVKKGLNKAYAEKKIKDKLNELSE